VLFGMFLIKSLFRFLLRATNGQNSPQFRYKNAHVALTYLPDSTGEYTPLFAPHWCEF
jgi:hypothetical protein